MPLSRVPAVDRASRILRMALRAVEETVILNTLNTYRDGHAAIVDRKETPHEVKSAAPLDRRLYDSAGAWG